jgi:hypothetical protein
VYSLAKVNYKPKVSVAHSKIPFVLGIIGGVLTVLVSLIALFPVKGLDALSIGLIVWGLVAGLVITAGAVLLKIENKFKLGSIILIVASVLALVTLQGLIVGPIISLIGGVLTKVRKMI